MLIGDLMEKYVSKERFIKDLDVQINLLDDLLLYHENKANSVPECVPIEMQFISNYSTQKLQLEELKTLSELSNGNTIYREEDGMFYVEQLSKKQYDDFMENLNDSFIPYQ